MRMPYWRIQKITTGKKHVFFFAGIKSISKSRTDRYLVTRRMLRSAAAVNRFAVCKLQVDDVCKHVWNGGQIGVVPNDDTVRVEILEKTSKPARLDVYH